MHAHEFISGAVLPAVVDRLRERILDREWDLSGLLVVTPGSRAGRVLLALLADEATNAKVVLSPPRLITPGEVASSVLFKLDHASQASDAPREKRALSLSPPASPIGKRMAWMKSIDSAGFEAQSALAPHVLMASSSSEPSSHESSERSFDAHSLGALADVLARSADSLAMAGLYFADAAARSTELPEFLGHDRLLAASRMQVEYAAQLARLGFCDPNLAAIDAMQLHASRSDQGDRSDRASTSDPLVELWLVAVTDLPPLAQHACTLPGVQTRAFIAGSPAWSEWFDVLGCMRDNVEAHTCDVWLNRASVPPLDRDDVWIGEDPREQASLALAAIARETSVRTLSPSDVTLCVPDPAVIFHLEREASRVGVRVRAQLGVAIDRTEPYRIARMLLQHAKDRTLASLRDLVARPRIEVFLRARVGEHVKTNNAPKGARARLARGLLVLIDDYAARTVHNSLDVPWRTRSNVDVFLLSQLSHAADELTNAISPSDRGDAASMALLGAIANVYHDVAVDPGAGPSFKRESESSQRIAEGLREAGTIARSLFPELHPLDAPTLVLDTIAQDLLPEAPSADAIEGLGWLEVLLDPSPTVILTGMNAGVVPSKQKPDPLLTGALLRLLGLDDSTTRSRRDAAIFAALHVCKQRVIVVMGRRNTDGSPLLPSPLLVSCDPKSIVDVLTRWTHEGSARTKRQFLRASHTDARSVEASLAEDAKPTQLPLLASHYLAPAAVSVTSLRDYLSSPRMFYFKHIVRVEARGVVPRGLEATSLGTLLHATMECLGDAGRDLTRSEAIAELLHDSLATQLEHRIALVTERTGTRSSLLRLQIHAAHARLDAAASVQARLRQEGWRIERVESSLLTGLRVEPVSGEPSLPILHAKIDRIDRHEATGALRVIDYKTGETAAKPRATHGGLTGKNPGWHDLQLPVYRHFAHAIVRDVSGDVPVLLRRSPELQPTPELALFWLCSDPHAVGITLADWSETELLHADDTLRRVLARIARCEWADIGDAHAGYDAIGSLVNIASSLSLCGTNGGTL